MGANFKKGIKIKRLKNKLMFVIFIIGIYLAIFVLLSRGILETRKRTRVLENFIMAKYFMPWKVGTLYLSVRLVSLLFSILDQMHKMIVLGREFDVLI